MLYPFSQTADPTTIEDSIRRRFMGANDPVLGTAEYLMQMAQIPGRAPEPAPLEVSGGSVIGLSPEQTTRLLDRVRQESMFNAETAAKQNAQRQESIDGLNTRVFRARDLERQRRERESQQAAEALQPRYFSGPDGQITQLNPGANGAPATTDVVKKGEPDVKQEDPNQHGQWIDTYGPDGKTIVKKFVTPKESGQVQVADTSPPSAANAPHVSGRMAIDGTPYGISGKVIMSQMSDGTTTILKDPDTQKPYVIPPGYTLQTDISGNSVLVAETPGVAPTTVPSPTPPAGGQPLRTDLPAGAMNDQQRSAEWDSAWRTVAESDFDFYKYPPEQQNAAVRAYLDNKRAAMSGQPAPAQPIPQGARVVDDAGLAGLPDGSIIRDPDTGQRFVIRGGEKVPYNG